MTSDILLVSSFKLSGIFLKTKGEFDIKSEVKAESPLRGMELVFHFMRKDTWMNSNTEIPRGLKTKNKGKNSLGKNWNNATLQE